jgi:hypothetical protein
MLVVGSDRFIAIPTPVPLLLSASSPFKAGSISSGSPETSVAIGAEANELVPTRWSVSKVGPC